jgi:mRNA (guanine-N7-)-methyltransferase
MQFCMHYAFETEDKVRMMLTNVTKFLRPGGIFLGTTPNSKHLLLVLHLYSLFANTLCFVRI